MATSHKHSGAITNARSFLVLLVSMLLFLSNNRVSATAIVPGTGIIPGLLGGAEGAVTNTVGAVEAATTTVTATTDEIVHDAEADVKYALGNLEGRRMLGFKDLQEK